MEASGLPLAARATKVKVVKAATVVNVRATATSSSKAAAAASGKTSREIPRTTYGDVYHNTARRRPDAGLRNLLPLVFDGCDRSSSGRRRF